MKHSLNNLIKKAKFDWVNPNITDKKFSDDEVFSKNVEIFHFNKELTSEQVIEKFKEKGYRPANIRELVWYASNGWNRKFLVIALGSVWRGLHDRLVPCLWIGGGERHLSLDWYDFGWGADYRFAGVKEVASEPLGTLDTSLEKRVKSLEENMEKIKKFLII